MAEGTCASQSRKYAQTGILDFDACFPDSVVGFTPHKGRASSIYIHFCVWVFAGDARKKCAAGGSKEHQPRPSPGVASPAPPFSLQEDFGRFVSHAIVVSENQKNSLALADNAFTSIQQRAFRGELDLSRLVLQNEIEAPARSADKLQNPLI